MQRSVLWADATQLSFCMLITVVAFVQAPIDVICKIFGAFLLLIPTVLDQVHTVVTDPVPSVTVVTEHQCTYQKTDSTELYQLVSFFISITQGKV